MINNYCLYSKLFGNSFDSSLADFKLDGWKHIRKIKKS